MNGFRLQYPSAPFPRSRCPRSRCPRSRTRRRSSRRSDLTRLSSRVVAAVLLATATLVGACGDDGRERSQTTVVELTHELPFSRKVVEIPGIDFGAAGSGAWLTDGWSHIESSADGTGFRWALGQSSALVFELLSSRDLELELTARSFPFLDGDSQTVEVLVNGASVGTLPLTTTWVEHSVPVPAAVLHAGRNEARFRYRRWYRPAEATTGPERPLAVAWRRLGLSNTRPAAAEAVSLRSDSALFVPSGVRLEFFVEIPAGGSLRLDGLQPRGDEPGRLVVTETSDESAESVLVEHSGRSGGIDVPLLDGYPGIVRLALTVDPAGEPLESAGFLLERPRIIAAAGTLEAPVETPTADASRRNRPNVLVYLVDTLRTDAVGAYGSDRGTSPEFDRFVTDATLFENAVGQSSWTRASVASLFTGLLPQRHGAIDRLDILSLEARTLPELLAGTGYETAAFITNPNVTGKFGFSQGFDEFAHIRTYRASDEVNKRVFTWLEQRSPDRPFLLYVHTMDPHHPYLPPDPWRPAFASTDAEMRVINRLLSRTPPPGNLVQHVDRFRALYDGAARFNDRSFGELVAHLAESDLLDDTVILFVSDHGEEFFEHGDWQHGKNLHAETLNVPLAVRFPDTARGSRVTEIVSHVDLLPTLLDYLDLEPPSGLDGRSVLSLLGGTDGSDTVTGRAFAHLSLDGHESVAVVDGEWKLVLFRTARGTMNASLYQWTSDPGEQYDLAGEHPIRVSYLESLIAKGAAADRPALSREEAEIDQELERSLKALGYLK